MSDSRLRIGTAPVNWNNFDLTDWRDPVPFPRILDEMRRAGYTATEWDASFGDDVDTLNARREERGIAFIAAYRWIDFQDPDAFDRDSAELGPVFRTLTGIGVRHLIVADRMRPERIAIAGAAPADGSASLAPGQLDALVANLHALARRAADAGLALHYHNHVGSYIESPAEVAALAERLDPELVDLCFDTGHYAFGGGDALRFLRDQSHRIGILHLKDVDPAVLAEAREHGWTFHESLRHYIFCPLGEGSAGIDQIVATLVERSFPGWVIVEQDTCRGDATENARANLDTLRGLVTANGGTIA
ncbi:MAG TPA: sugar phosphate isomerase/epimerase [Thermomicrobiales bacterium]|nr:sugar phosphate isomerase/epimerase [Thermomicrobiales bacterium]